MSRIKKTLAPPNSVIFVADPSRPYNVPEDSGAALVASTPSCISIGTLAEMDGKTTIELGNTIENTTGMLKFDDEIETPGLKIAVIDAETNSLIEMAVSYNRTNIRVWVNDLNEPDHIIIQAR
jgi:hypothetical protein